jgi:Asp-tRNA(Asn)/Glu-tRNA(Gln) amidotransferase A subunit family amidase
MSDDITELTIAQTHDRFERGTLTCEELVEGYVERIAAYDDAGPELGAVITVNDGALERARELDAAFAADGPVGPLHGVPVLIKDQVQTADTVTSYGSEAFTEFVPETDAEIVTKLREAGAVVLAKTNMPDWGSGFVGYSSAAGQTKNPYSLDRDSGGSSAGTGAGLAANLGLVGIGSDTGGSVRVPAAYCNLYGLRVTTGIISRDGVSAMVSRQDTTGPMARTLEDMVRLLDVLEGYDPADDVTDMTVHSRNHTPYLDHLDTGGLTGRRIGVLRDAFGSPDNPAAAPVTPVVEAAIERISAAGADIIDPVTIEDLDAHIDGTSLYAYQAKHDITSYLEDLPGAPVGSVAELFENDQFHDALELFYKIAGGPDDPGDHPDYWERVAAQESFRRAIERTHAEHGLDAIVFPDVQVVPPEYTDYYTSDMTREEFNTNTFIASQSGCPAVSMPAGFTDGGLPVGLELMGVPHSEARLVELAAGYDDVTDARRSPDTAPPLG